MPTFNRRGLLVPLLGGLIFLSLGLYGLYEASVRYRVDTPVEAVAVGEPGCVVAATFTDRGGVERVVDVRRYKANCLSADPGESITVYYDASDPAVHSHTRSWWWPILAVAMFFSISWIALGATLRCMRGGEMPYSRSKLIKRAAPTGRNSYTVDYGPSQPVYEETPIPEEELGYYWDWATGMLNVLTEAVRSEAALPADRRETRAGDDSLLAVANMLERSVAALHVGRYALALRIHSEAAHIVADQWSNTAALSTKVLECRPILERLAKTTG